MWARAVVAAEKRLRGRLAVGVFSLFSAGPVQSLRPAAELSRRRPRRRARMRKLPRRRWLHLVNCERYHKSTVTLGRRPAIAARKISIRLSGERTMRRLRLFIAIRSGEIPHGSTSGSRQRRRRSQDRIERDHAIDERPCRDSGAGARIHTPSFSPRRRRLSSACGSSDLPVSAARWPLSNRIPDPHAAANGRAQSPRSVCGRRAKTTRASRRLTSIGGDASE
jgi:hypothetical protein